MLRATNLNPNESFHIRNLSSKDEKGADFITETHLPSIILHLALMISLIQGVVLAYFSTREPIYKFLIYNEFMSYFGEIYEEQEAIQD